MIWALIDFIVQNANRFHWFGLLLGANSNWFVRHCTQSIFPCGGIECQCVSESPSAFMLFIVTMVINRLLMDVLLHNVNVTPLMVSLPSIVFFELWLEQCAKDLPNTNKHCSGDPWSSESLHDSDPPCECVWWLCEGRLRRTDVHNRHFGLFSHPPSASKPQ